jgi:hypothetical protein
MGISRHLIYAGRLILVNSVFPALPTFYMCSITLPTELLEQIDKYRKHALWHGGDVKKKGGYLVAWKHACRSKEEGGLGIINLKNHNSALLMKFLHKFYNRLDLPWVELTWHNFYKNGKPPNERKNKGYSWWRDIISLAPNFLLLTQCKVRSGLSVSFWNDHWDFRVIKSLYPCRMDLPGPTTSVGTRTDYSVGPWDYPACATRHLKAWSTRTTQE